MSSGRWWAATPSSAARTGPDAPRPPGACRCAVQVSSAAAGSCFGGRVGTKQNQGRWMPVDSQFDVWSVIGAGPAGLAAASRLVDDGRAVLILDRATARSRWGGVTFTGAIRGPLSELGCWEAFVRAGHVAGYERQCAWGGEPRAENALFQPEGPLWHVDRDRFDADLRCAVHKRGAAFETYRKLESVRLENGCWCVELGCGRVVEARYLVDATGRQRTLSRRLGARIESHDRLVGLTARVARNQATAEVRSMLLQATPFGWWYAAPIPNGHVLVLFTDADLTPFELRRRLRPTAANSAFTDTEGQRAGSRLMMHAPRTTRCAGGGVTERWRTACGRGTRSRRCSPPATPGRLWSTAATAASSTTVTCAASSTGTH